jgi:hypothetical protein
VIADPAQRGRSLGEMYLRLEPALWSDITDSDLLVAGDEDRAHREWECFALYACVRGLVAAGGFDDENVRAIDAMHDAVATSWDAAAPGTAAQRREHAAQRYDEYGELVRHHAAEGDDVVTARLGEAAARHVSGTDIAHAELGIMLGELHEAIVQGAAESVRTGGE